MDRQDSLRKWIFSALLVAAGVLLSPLFSFPLGVTRAFPLQHMINIFLAVLCGTRFSTSAAFGMALIRNILGTGSLLAFPGSMIGAFLSGYLYSKTQKLWCAVLGDFEGCALLCVPLLHFLRRRLRHRFLCFKKCSLNSNRITQKQITSLSISLYKLLFIIIKSHASRIFFPQKSSIFCGFFVLLL